MEFPSGPVGASISEPVGGAPVRESSSEGSPNGDSIGVHWSLEMEIPFLRKWGLHRGPLEAPFLSPLEGPELVKVVVRGFQMEILGPR